MQDGRESELLHNFLPPRISIVTRSVPLYCLVFRNASRAIRASQEAGVATALLVASSVSSLLCLLRAEGKVGSPCISFSVPVMFPLLCSVYLTIRGPTLAGEQS
jgi:hypothetical protein